MISGWVLLLGIYVLGYLIGRKDGREAQFRDDYRNQRLASATVDKLEPRKGKQYLPWSTATSPDGSPVREYTIDELIDDGR